MESISAESAKYHVSRVKQWKPPNKTPAYKCTLLLWNDFVAPKYISS